MARVGKEEGAGLLPALSSPGCEMAAHSVGVGREEVFRNKDVQLVVLCR